MTATQRLGFTFRVLSFLALAGVVLVPLTGWPQDRGGGKSGPRAERKERELTAEEALALEQLVQARRELLQAQSELRKSQVELAGLQAKLQGLTDVGVPPAAL